MIDLWFPMFFRSRARMGLVSPPGLNRYFKRIRPKHKRGHRKFKEAKRG